MTEDAEADKHTHAPRSPHLKRQQRSQTRGHGEGRQGREDEGHCRDAPGDDCGGPGELASEDVARGLHARCLGRQRAGCCTAIKAEERGERAAAGPCRRRSRRLCQQAPRHVAHRLQPSCSWLGVRVLFAAALALLLEREVEADALDEGAAPPVEVCAATLEEAQLPEAPLRSAHAVLAPVVVGRGTRVRQWQSSLVDEPRDEVPHARPLLQRCCALQPPVVPCKHNLLCRGSGGGGGRGRATSGEMFVCEERRSSSSSGLRGHRKVLVEKHLVVVGLWCGYHHRRWLESGRRGHRCSPKSTSFITCGGGDGTRVGSDGVLERPACLGRSGRAKKSPDAACAPAEEPRCQDASDDVVFADGGVESMQLRPGRCGIARLGCGSGRRPLPVRSEAEARYLCARLGTSTRRGNHESANVVAAAASPKVGQGSEAPLEVTDASAIRHRCNGRAPDVHGCHRESLSWRTGQGTRRGVCLRSDGSKLVRQRCGGDPCSSRDAPSGGGSRRIICEAVCR